VWGGDLRQNLRAGAGKRAWALWRVWFRAHTTRLGGRFFETTNAAVVLFWAKGAGADPTTLIDTTRQGWETAGRCRAWLFRLPGLFRLAASGFLLPRTGGEKMSSNLVEDAGQTTREGRPHSPFAMGPGLGRNGGIGSLPFGLGITYGAS